MVETPDNLGYNPTLMGLYDDSRLTKTPDNLRHMETAVYWACTTTAGFYWACTTTTGWPTGRDAGQPEAWRLQSTGPVRRQQCGRDAGPVGYDDSKVAETPDNLGYV